MPGTAEMVGDSSSSFFSFLFVKGFANVAGGSEFFKIISYRSLKISLTDTLGRLNGQKQYWYSGTQKGPF